MDAPTPQPTRALMLSVFVIATCGLIYELLAGTIASYLLGDSVTQFSTVIGVYLFAMGVGSYLSRFLDNDLLDRFLDVEVLVGLVGGMSSLVLFTAYAEVESFRVVLYGLVLLTGTLVGLEIPLLMRILEHELELKELVARVLTLDYLGALGASILFPLWLVPKVGLLRSSFAFGVLNVAVAIWAGYLFRRRLRRPRRAAIQAWAALLLLLAGFVYSDQLMGFAEQRIYKGKVVYAESSPYQRIILTHQSGGETRLFLNGDLQFSSIDEHRYHEALVHPALASSAAPRRVLVLGGGDGMAVREVLRDARVERVVLVDLDPRMTEIFRRHPDFAALNSHALDSPRVEIHNADAFVWLEEHPDEIFDVVLLDFPDPSNFSLGKLYTTTFYQRLLDHLAPGGIVAVQATSPLITRRAFWCIVATLEAVGLEVVPYQAAVPSFGIWGFALAGRRTPRPLRALPEGLRFLSPSTLPGLFAFPPDMARAEVEINRLDNQILVSYHREALDRLGG